MVSDDELERHIQAYERTGDRGDLRRRVDQLEQQTRIVHDEVLHRVETARANAATRDDLSAIVERLDAIESRLDDLEADVEDS